MHTEISDCYSHCATQTCFCPTLYEYLLALSTSRSSPRANLLNMSEAADLAFLDLRPVDMSTTVTRPQGLH